MTRLYIHLLFAMCAASAATGDICADNNMVAVCEEDSRQQMRMIPKLRTVVSDEQLIDAMTRVFSMSDGSEMTTSPAERVAECMLNPSSTLCLTGATGGLSIESVEYMSNLFRWLNVEMLPGNQTQLLVDISQVCCVLSTVSSQKSSNRVQPPAI